MRGRSLFWFVILAMVLVLGVFYGLFQLVKVMATN